MCLQVQPAGGLNTRVTLCLFGLCASRINPAHFRVLVGLSGLEPPTSRLSGVRSNRLSYKPISWPEANRLFAFTLAFFGSLPPARLLVPFLRKGPARCARRLSLLVEINGIEPLTPCLQSRCSPS